jgi:hypothetical protein
MNKKEMLALEATYHKVLEGTDSTDNKGKVCTKCQKGKYEETSITDDQDGVLHCTSCGAKVSRYSEEAAEEPHPMARPDMYNPEGYKQMYNRLMTDELSEGDWQEYCMEYLKRILEQPEIVAVMQRLKSR